MYVTKRKFNSEINLEANVVGFLPDGRYLVEKNSRLNIADKEGRLISKCWYSYLSFLENGLIKVKKSNNEWNFLDQQGNLLVRNLWFDFVGDFKNGLAKVKRIKLWNFINEQGELINAVWFNLVFDFQANGLALVKQDRTWYFLDKQAKLTAIKLPKIRAWLTEEKEESRVVA